MQVRIEINCETDAELIGCLEAIKTQTKKALKKEPKAKQLRVEDDNCGGDFILDIADR